MDKWQIIKDHIKISHSELGAVYAGDLTREMFMHAIDWTHRNTAKILQHQIPVPEAATHLLCDDRCDEDEMIDYIVEVLVVIDAVQDIEPLPVVI